MAFMTMDNRLILQHEQIDQGHQMLFDQIELIVQAIEAGNGKQECLKIVNGFHDLTSKHFAVEEGLMAQPYSPYAALHKEEHDSFIAGIADFRSQLEAGTGSCNSAALNHLRTAFSAHIMRSDKSLVAELSKQND